MVDNAEELKVIGMVPTGLLIGGEWGPADNGATFAVEDPSTGKVLAEVADASPADGLRALDAAAKAQPAWAAAGTQRDPAPRLRAAARGRRS
jgi:succinate-semialdehyde dehydrogenase/glutarate-semialdehyde dehydrogenase